MARYWLMLLTVLKISPAKEAVATPTAAKGFDVNELVGKAKDLFQKRKIAVIGALAAVAVLIVALVGFKVYDSQPKSLLDVVQVQFSATKNLEH